MYNEAAGSLDLDLVTLLGVSGLTPERLVVMGHKPSEKKLQDVLPWLVTQKRELFENYQAIQSGPAARTLRRATHVAVFIKLEDDDAAFVGLYEIQKPQPLSVEAFWDAPGLSELRELGYAGKDQTSADLGRFPLHLHPVWQSWVGRLIVGWPKHRTMVRLADTTPFPVRAITQESVFVGAMPHWQELTFTWGELKLMPPSWKARIAEWRGIYYIFDSERRLGYVGCASGQQNIMGRWINYTNTGHGGNRRLAESNPSHLMFSILQRTSPDMPRSDLEALEKTWMKRLHTRAFGMNAN